MKRNMMIGLLLLGSLVTNAQVKPSGDTQKWKVRLRAIAAIPGEVVFVFLFVAFFSSIELVFDVDEDEDVDDILIYNDRIFYHKREEIMFC